MEETGFRVVFARHFDRPTPLEGEDGMRNWIQMFAGNLLEGLPENDKELIISETERSLRGSLYNNGQWIADYKRIQVVGIKE